MSSALNPVLFTLDIEGVSHELQVLEFRAREAINQPYEVHLELVSDRRDIDLHALHHRAAFLCFSPGGGGLHGQIQTLAEGDAGHRLSRYQMTLVPRLAYLAHRHNQRIFQHLSAPQIIEKVLKDHGILADTTRFYFGTQYPARPYCVQYESDLHFIQRLCEEEGLHFHFEHSAQGHVLVFGDDQNSFTRTGQQTAYCPSSGLVAQAPVIERFTVQINTRTSQVRRRDYHFEIPHVQLDCATRNTLTPRLEDYAYPGAFTERKRGDLLAGRALERHRFDCCQGTGSSDQSAMRSGHFFKMTEHPKAERNGTWLLSEVEHQGRQPQVLEESIGDIGHPDGFTQGYRNTFVATPWDVPFRPALEHPKPQMKGPQHAIVTGPPGQEIYCDRYGRVKVQLLWDRDGERNEHSSCWLRVATSWAHDRYGNVLVPRVGMEVQVAFSDGDPDRPYVLCCLANAETPLPLDLPGQLTRSVFRSRSSPGGGGYNELRIEDRQGAEHIALRAQRDFLQRVLNDEQIQVDNRRSVVVGGNASHDLRGEEHHLTHGNRLTELKRDDHLLVLGDQHIRVASQRLSAGQQIHLNAAQQVVIDGGASVTLMAGGQWLTLGPQGIFASVPIVQGGAAPVSLPAQPLMPGVVPMTLATLDIAQQRQALTAARTSRCPICEQARP